jgi:hypothetical protein
MSDFYSDKVVATIIGAAVGAVLTASGKWLLDRRRERVEARRKRHAETKVENFLWGVFCSLDEHSERDFATSSGFFWKGYLSEELRALAKESRDVIDGAAFVSMIRICAALERFSFERDNLDASVFSADELIKETCLLLKTLIPRVIKSEAERAKKIQQLDERIQLMHIGYGPFREVGPE